MDTLRNRGKEKGVATILVVGALLFLILFFFVLAIDFAYVYTARGQLQNAADAAALAGADLLSPNQYDTVQTLARQEAIKFANQNYVTGQPVTLADTDIEVGFWDGNTFHSSTAPVNSIKVTAKREGSNAVKLFFGSIVGWPTMDIERIAIASRPARANVPISLCIDSCQAPIGDKGFVVNATTGTKFYWSTPYDSDIINSSIQQIAWTAFNEESSVNTGDVIPFFCGSVFDSCDTSLATNNGYNNAVALQFRCAFLNPLYDSDHKTCENSFGTPKPCNSIDDKVTSWSVLSPYTNICPPSTQGKVEPYPIAGYAEVKIIDVWAKGPATSAASANNCACSSLGPENYVNATDENNKAIIINGISCIDCGDPQLPDVFGRKAFLVR